uniref:Dynein heavy chain tail domain-containing protein n=1 Tax=Cacopsylla melanoneura TaxID=428564 RepID=A0A8D8VMM0_9HEMI
MVKDPMMQFIAMRGFQYCNYIVGACEEYMALAEQFRKYEESMLGEWLLEVKPIIEVNMSSPIFRIVKFKDSKFLARDEGGGGDNSGRPYIKHKDCLTVINTTDTVNPLRLIQKLGTNTLPNIRAQSLRTSMIPINKKLLEESCLADRGLTIEVNYRDEELATLLPEVDALLHLGIEDDLPPIVQGLYRYRPEVLKLIPRLETLLERYTNMMSRTDQNQRIILQCEIFKLETVLIEGTKKDFLLNTSPARLDPYLKL